jgi:SAM-dependent methyltransferase
MNSRQPNISLPSSPGFYDLVAPIYDSHWGRGFFSSVSRLFRRHIEPRVPAGGRVLDLCCGSGRFAGYMGQAGYRVTGVDSSAALLAEAVEHAPQAHLVRAQMSAFALAETFDAAVCLFNSLNHAQDECELERIFACVARHLTHSAPFLFDVILEEDYLQSWKSDEYVLSSDSLYELSYRYSAQARVATCRVQVRSRLDPKHVESEAVSEQRPFHPDAIDHALRRAGFSAVFLKMVERAHPPHGRLLVLANRRP